MIAIFKKIWLFAGEEQKNIRNSVCIGFVHAIFHMLQIGALFLTIRALVRESVDTSLIWSVVALMLISIAGKIVTNYFSQLKQTHGGFYMAANKRVDIANRMKLIPMGYYNQSSLGNITGIATTVLSDVEMTAPIVMVLTLGGFITTVIFLLYILIFDWRMGLLATLWVVLFLFIISSMEKKSRESAPKRQLAQASLVERVLETIQGMSVVKSFHLTKLDDKKIDKAIEQSKNRNLAMEKLLTPYTILQQSILRIGSVSLMAASLLFYFAGTMELTYSIMFIVVSFIIFEQIESVGHGMSILRVCGSSIEQANQMDDVPVMDVNGKAQISGSHDIEFEHVHFSYEKRKILDDITVTLPEGTMTAIVGPSGSGKTTFCNLIARFWDVDQGSIKIGGIDIRNYTLESLMDQISMVFQNVYLFGDTIENNIRFGRQTATREEVIAAAKKACCHDFIMDLPEQYDTIIGEKGFALSGGEKQRISIARAILKDAPIIIFDEATASVDPENEERLQAAILELTKNKTIIMIAHRLKTVRHANQILVIDGGHIVQNGTHEELFEQEGIYKSFIAQRKEAATWEVV